MSRLEQYIDRVRAIAFAPSEANGTQQADAVSAYLDAARQVVLSTGCPSAPTAMLAQQMDPAIEVDPQSLRMVNQVNGLTDHSVALLSEGLRWQALADRSRYLAALPDPYTHVLQLAEAGGALEAGPAGVVQLATGNRETFPAWDANNPPKASGHYHPLEQWLWTRLVVRGLEPAGVSPASYELVQGERPRIDGGGLWVQKQDNHWLVGSAERGVERAIGTFANLGLAARYVHINLTDIIGPWAYRQDGADETDDVIVARALGASGLDESQYNIGDSEAVDGGLFAAPASDGSWTVGYSERGQSSSLARFATKRHALSFLHTLATNSVAEWATMAPNPPDYEGRMQFRAYGLPWSKTLYAIEADATTCSLPPTTISGLPTDRAGNRLFVELRHGRTLNAKSGLTAPWFGQPGGATQYELEAPIQHLIDSGILIDITESQEAAAALASAQPPG